MRDWNAARVAGAGRAELVRRADAGGGQAGPARVVIDSRAIAPGDLFVAIPGARVDGGAFAAAALAAGAWGVLVTPQWAPQLAGSPGNVLVSEDPVTALGAMAREWRRELGAKVIGVTGSVGKTSTKELIAAMIAPHRTVAASRANFNTEIGLPLELLAASPGTQVVVLELAMRGAGQIAELASICEPDVGVITNIAPVHIEQLGSIEGVARAKAELLAGMRAGAAAIVPAGEKLLERWLRSDLDLTSFGEGGEITWRSHDVAATPDGDVTLELPFSQAHQRRNALAAIGAALAVGVRPGGAIDVSFGDLRGERVAITGGATVINDCYNANPLSMRAALDDLAQQQTSGRRIAVLGDMLELGSDEERLHREVGAHAAGSQVELLVTVGVRARAMAGSFTGEAISVDDAPAAAEALRPLLREGDLVLVKGSRGVGLERVVAALAPVSDSPAVTSQDEETAR